MTIQFSTRNLFIVSFALVILTNIVVLTGVVYNRSGEPESKIILTERELPKSYQNHRYNSALSLKLAWRTLGPENSNYNYIFYGSPSWFNSEKLEGLGYRLTNLMNNKSDSESYKKYMSKQVFIVLENNGDAYRAALRRAELALKKETELADKLGEDKTFKFRLDSAKKSLAFEQTGSSRLFAIDAGLDAAKLREHYQDQSRFMIVKGIVEPRIDYVDKNKVLKGYIKELNITKIHVPLHQRKILDSILKQYKSKRAKANPPRYQVELAYGRRFEPWLVAIQSLAGEN